MDDLFEKALGCFATFFMIALAIGVVVLFGECYYDRASFDAQAACKVRRMESTRRTLSRDVVCVPINTRQDTTTVNVRTP